MGLKITSGVWSSASEENREQRNAARETFFRESGVQVASSLRDVYMSPAVRITRVMELMTKSIAPRIEDTDLPVIAVLAQAALAETGLAVPSMPTHFDSRPLGVSALAPEVLNSFFETDAATALERSLF